MTDVIVIGVDPGREKCGIAVVARLRGILQHQVIATAALGQVVLDLMDEYEISAVIIGDGTSSRSALKVLQAAMKGKQIPVHRVDERHTTEQARRRYWVEQPPHGWRRLWPLSMQTPPKPVDDYVAVILAERYLQSIAAI